MASLPDVSPTLGVYQIGVLLSCILFGVTTTQLYIYYTRFPDDSRALKAFVAFVWMCEAAHCACVIHTLDFFVIKHYGHPEVFLGALPISFDVSVFFSGVITSSVQSFFIYRTYSLSKQPIIPIFLWLMSLSWLVIVMIVTGTASQMTSFPAYEEQWGWLLTTSWALGAATDVAIAAALVWLLARRRRDIHSKSIPLVDKLVLWTIENGTLTSVLSVLKLVFFVVMKKNFGWLAFYVIGARVFANCLLASLNGRSTLRQINITSVAGTHDNRIQMPNSSNDRPTKATIDLEMDARYASFADRDLRRGGKEPV